jgi:hypothetical protein
MKCGNPELRPKNKFLRQFIIFDRCKYFEDIKGIHQYFAWKDIQICYYENICRHYTRR